MNRNVLLQERAAHRDAADALTLAALKSGKDLSGPELDQFNWRMGEIKNITEKLERADAAAGITWKNSDYPHVPVVMPGGSRAPLAKGNGPTIGRDSEGRVCPIFAKGQSV